MNIKRVTTIVPTGYLEDLERCLRAAGVPGMTIDNVKGFGEHANYFSSDLLKSNARVELYVGEDRCGKVCEAICQFAAAAHTSAGILVIESVDRMIDLNTGQDVPACHL